MMFLKIVFHKFWRKLLFEKFSVNGAVIDVVKDFIIFNTIFTYISKYFDLQFFILLSILFVVFLLYKIHQYFITAIK